MLPGPRVHRELAHVGPLRVQDRDDRGRVGRPVAELRPGVDHRLERRRRPGEERPRGIELRGRLPERGRRSRVVAGRHPRPARGVDVRAVVHRERRVGQVDVRGRDRPDERQVRPVRRVVHRVRGGEAVRVRAPRLHEVLPDQRDLARAPGPAPGLAAGLVEGAGLEVGRAAVRGGHRRPGRARRSLVVRGLLEEPAGPEPQVRERREPRRPREAGGRRDGRARAEAREQQDYGYQSWTFHGLAPGDHPPRRPHRARGVRESRGEVGNRAAA